MELTIKGESKEIADLVLELQSRQKAEVSMLISGEALAQSILSASRDNRAS